jgi:hypothetical protein
LKTTTKTHIWLTQAKDLEKVKKCDLSAKFIKANKSEYLSNLEEGWEDKLNKVRSVFVSNGNNILSHKRREMPEAKTDEVTIFFHLAKTIDTDEDKHNANTDEVFGQVDPGDGGMQ